MKGFVWSRLIDGLAPAAPARRLALVRVAVALFACGWLMAVGVDLVGRAQLHPSRFAPVGVAGVIGRVSPTLVIVALVVVLGLSLVVAAGRAHRVAGPAFAVGLLWLLSYRNSWGHLSHVEHLLVIHAGIVGLAPAADAMQLGVRARAEPAPHARYGWPLRLMMLVTVSTYAVAGLAKLRLGGMMWLSGETVRLHVAHEVLRMGLVGQDTAAVGQWLLPYGGVFSVMAVSTVVLEVGAPLALLPGRIRVLWVGGLWAMHLGIAVIMGIGFAYPLSGVAFASFGALERITDRWRRPAPEP